MNKAFIFDMDGVIINSETMWEKYGNEFYLNLLGRDIAGKIGDATGLSLPLMYDAAAEYGFSKSREEFYRAFDEQAKSIYAKATITSGFEDLVSFLKFHDFHLAIVSASPQSWIDMTLAKTDVSNSFDYILSLHERDDLQHKPHPDGYREAMRVLEVKPEQTIIIEDSNRGIQSAKTSGARTIGFRQLIPKGYMQTGADIYVNTFEEVIKLLESKFLF